MSKQAEGAQAATTNHPKNQPRDKDQAQTATPYATPSKTARESL